jgi:nucleoside-diphosphate-sugar epimerase
MSAVCMLGASGFVGARTLRLALRNGTRVRALAHRRALPAGPGLEVVEGDAGDGAALDRLLEPQALVLNFAYAADGGRLAHALAQACVRRGVQRLVHVSTCSVYGAAPGALIDEQTLCAPVTAYERAKHAAEELLERETAARCELVILRPTAVFGPGGKNLETLARRVLHQGWPRRYLRACAMGRRRMHAVDVECVAAAALFAASAPLVRPAERFIVSQDDEAANDYASLEAFFVRRFAAARYPLPPVSPPAALLGLALRAAGRSDVEPQRRYSSANLAGRGFSRPRPFAAALEEYAAWIEQHARP